MSGDVYIGGVLRAGVFSGAFSASYETKFGPAWNLDNAWHIIGPHSPYYAVISIGVYAGTVFDGNVTKPI